MINTNNIKLDEKRFNGYQEQNNGQEEELTNLKPISKINIFVGANNSGKSMFMRLLSTTKDFLVDTSVIEISEETKEFFSKYSELIQNKFSTLYVVDGVSKNSILEYLQVFLGKIPAHPEFSSLLLYINTLKRNLESAVKININSTFNHTNGYQHIDPFSPDDIEKIVFESENALAIVNKIIDNCKDNESKDAKRVYIPVLRGLRLLTNQSSQERGFTDYYKETTDKDYFTDFDNKPTIFSGLGFYKELTDLLLGNNEQRISVQKYQEFIRENLFENKKVELIPNQTTKTVIVKIGDEIEREIHLLGDGIQSAIILTFLPFVTNEPTYFFIEEPEIYLHPGLQRKILEFFNSDEWKHHKFFMTTHSNHFLDITIDIKDVSIFTFRKRLEDGEHNEKSANFTIEAVDGTDQSSLELLGVRNSSVFLVNATIWVEGITDRWYLRKMLNSYMEFLEKKKKLNRKLEEDVHYCFVEYSGSNITHWSFLNKEDHPIVVKRLCAKAMVVVDDDGGKKAERKKELLEVLTKKNLIVLPCNEIENLLPYKIIKSIVAEYEKVDESELPDINYEFYKDKYLGSFIHENILLNKKPRRKGGYKTDSGTIKDKRIFCEKALDKIEFSKLPNSTQKVIKDIYNFIVKQNS
jgi:AAA15 family ATPase/GTPase